MSSIKKSVTVHENKVLNIENKTFKQVLNFKKIVEQHNKIQTYVTAENLTGKMQRYITKNKTKHIGHWDTILC